MSPHHYYFSVPDLGAAHGDDPDFAFAGHSPDALAAAVQGALRTSGLFDRWRARQEDPDRVDKSLSQVDPHAVATAEQADLRVDLEVTTTLAMQVVRHRLNLLIGNHWRLHDVR